MPATSERTELIQSLRQQLDILAGMDADDETMSAPVNMTGEPTEEQLAKMNRFRPQGMPPYKIDEVLSVELRASHNLLSFDRKAWTPKALRLMAEDYPGKAYLLDHDWGDSDRVIGFIYDAELIRHPEASMDDLDYLDYREINQGIVAKDGFYELILRCCVQRGTPIEQNIRFRRYAETSTGGYHWVQHLCPHCNTKFDDDDCPHIPPTWYIMMLKDEGMLAPEEVAMIAPYIIRDSNKTAMLEVSQVLSGNLVTTKIKCDQ